MNGAIEVDSATIRRLIDAVADAVATHTGELTALDQAIGDGDHGINMKRGFDAVRADAGKIAEKRLTEAFGGRSACCLS